MLSVIKPFPQSGDHSSAFRPGCTSPKHGTAEVQAREIRLGQQGGEKRKTLRAKVLGGSQKIFWETRKLFSSFLRGASCPKSPRVAATAAVLFMPESVADVKGGTCDQN